MRKAPDRNPSPISRATDGLVHEERTYRFLTPVFGGGVRVDGHIKPADTVTPVRVPSIRGQLRFWWRACNPQGCRTLQELYERESLIFGSTEAPSALGIAIVTPPDAMREFPVLEGGFGAVGGMLGLAYGAFPLRDTQRGSAHGVLHEYPGEWTIALTYPKCISDDVEAALWAWAHFGGLGGRTRRGFGAIAEVGRGEGALPTIERGWSHYVRHPSGAAAKWPQMPGDMSRWRTKAGNWTRGVEVQNYLLGLLRGLRQGSAGRKQSSEQGQGRNPGRSYWPEPDAIRAITGVRARAHAERVTRVDAFPRAAFGLPLIFRFNDKPDPPPTTLMPRVGGARFGRLASPLILRPHAAPDGKLEALALVLSHPDFDDLALAEDRREHVVPTRRLTESEARDLGVGGRPSPLRKGSKVFVDPLDRFLEELA